jgi:hypothetical protein
MDCGGQEMKRVMPAKAPAGFRDRCREPGRNWLKANPSYRRPRDYWSQFEPQLRQAFSERCGYCAMVTMRSQVDHFVPVAVLKVRKQDWKAYEWSNFRYGEGVLNQRKSNHLVLDPFKVRDDWFEVQLPGLQLVLTAAVPKTQRTLAEFTITRLGLRDSEVVVRYRRKWFEMYRARKMDLEGLKEVAPLISSAVERDLAKGIDWRK